MTAIKPNHKKLLSLRRALAGFYILSALISLAVPASTLAALPTIKVAVLRVTFTNTSGADIPPAKSQIMAMGGVMDNYFKEESGNATGLAINYFQDTPLNYPAPTACDAATYVSELQTVWEDAKNQAAAAPGNPFNPDAYDQILIAMPPVCSPTWRAGADFSTPKKRQWLYTQFMHPYNAIHEMGHNFNLGHANLLECPSNRLNPTNKPSTDLSPANYRISGNITLDDSCTTLNYGDGLSIMGQIDANFDPTSWNAVHYEKLNEVDNFGWTNVIYRNVVPSGSSQTYNIAPFSAFCNQTKVLKIQRQATSGSNLSDQLYVEYRQGRTGGTADQTFNAGNPDLSSNIEIRIKSAPLTSDAPQSAGESQLIGTLAPGKTLTDAVGRVSIKLNGFSPAGANVTIQYF